MSGQARRIEMFSDGVFAIAITLLVLELPFGKVAEGDLARALGDHWARFGAYALSFLGIGLAWLQHHAVFEHIRSVDRTILLLNLLFLAAIAFLPYPTSLLGDYIQETDNATVAAVIYSGAWIVATAALTLLWRHSMRTGAAMGPGARRLASYYRGTLVAYVVFTAVALISPIAMVVLYACTGVVFLWRGDYTVLGSEPAD
jgi:uncharacterized membrane protein